jgi:hypothetical protein
MQSEIEELRLSANQHQFNNGEINVGAEINRIKKELQESRMSKRSSLEGFEALSRKRSPADELTNHSQKVESDSKIKSEL